MFDNILVMSSGSICYTGEPLAGVEYFSMLELKLPELTNPADWYLDLVTDGVTDPVLLQNIKNYYKNIITAITIQIKSF